MPTQKTLTIEWRANYNMICNRQANKSKVCSYTSDHSNPTLKKDIMVHWSLIGSLSDNSLTLSAVRRQSTCYIASNLKRMSKCWTVSCISSQSLLEAVPNIRRVHHVLAWRLLPQTTKSILTNLRQAAVVLKAVWWIIHEENIWSALGWPRYRASRRNAAGLTRTWHIPFKKNE